MNKANQINFRHVLLTLVLVFVMALSFLAGTISVDAGWFKQDENRATTNQISAVSANLSLLLLSEEKSEIIFLPLIMK
jgi:hypothetical protein